MNMWFVKPLATMWPRKEALQDDPAEQEGDYPWLRTDDIEMDAADSEDGIPLSELMELKRGMKQNWPRKDRCWTIP